MAQHYSPRIVQDGLVMCLDASQNSSYPTTDLPVKNGLIMWMDASDDTTFSYSSGSIVSQWRDKSGSNYHMVPVSAGPTRNVFLNSRKVLAFTNTQDIQNLSIDLRTSAYSIFVVSRYTNAASGTGRILTSNSSYNNWLLGHWASEVNKYYANGWVYSTYAAIDTNWKLYLGDWGGPSNDLANFYGAGTAIATNSADASAGPWTLGISAYSGEKSNCEVAEIIVFNRILTTAERILVHTYLGQKWRILNTDRSIIDLSGNNNHGLLGNGTTGNMPTFNYYNKSLTYNKGESDTLVVTNSTSLKTNNITIELYMKFNSAIASNTGDYIQMGIGSGVGQFYFRNENPNLSWNWYPASSASSNLGYAISNFATDTYYLITLTGDSGGASKMYVNGSQVASAANVGSSITSWTTNNLTIGGYVWDGYSNTDIALTRIYNKVLSASEISQNYEAIKSRFANTIVQQGLILNLDVGNPYSYAGAGTTWYDVSGNNYSGSLTNGPVYSTVNSGIIVFDGSNDYVDLTASTFSISGNASRSMFAWVKTTYNGNQAFIATGTPAGSQAFILVKYGSYVGVMGYNNDFYPSSGRAIADGVWHYVGATFDGTNLRTYVDGVLDNTSGTITYSTTGQNNYVGRSNHAGNENFINGSMGNAQIYNIALSATQVLQNYNATKGRFGL